MIKKGSLYSASDKAFFDALCQHKMSKPALHELLWRRGVLKSKKEEKEVIARYFSRLDHDYFDHKLISDKISTESNREKQTSHFTSTSFSLSTLEKVAKELVNERKGLDNSINYVASGQSIQLSISYSYYDHNKPEFKQLVTRDAIISIESSENGLCIRAPDNEYISEVTSKLLSEIKGEHQEEFEFETISLYGVGDVEKKISFFQSLITGIDNMQLLDVSDVAVYNPDTGDDKDNIGVHVRRASLNGEGILKSGELKQFYDKGFFVYRISWSVIEKDKQNSDIYNFQAQFNDPESCRKFSYIAKGFRRCLENGEHAKSPSRLSLSEEIRVMRLIEQSARRAKKSIFKSTVKEENHEEDKK